MGLAITISGWGDSEGIRSSLLQPPGVDSDSSDTRTAAKSVPSLRLVHICRIWLDPLREEGRFEVLDFTGIGFETVITTRTFPYETSESRSSIQDSDFEKRQAIPYGEMLEPEPLLRQLDPIKVSKATFLNRPVVDVDARPLPDAQNLLLPVAEAYRLLVDAETGILLRLEASLRGRVFVRWEVLELSLGGEFVDGG